jgi:hypothetical protein
MAKFRLGDHEFHDPDETSSSIDAFTVGYPRRPIRGAAPPSFLAAFAVEAAADGPAAALLDGEFCGHGEPTFTIFELALDGERNLNLSVPLEAGDEPTVLARPASGAGPWRKLFSVPEVFPFSGCDAGGEPPKPVADDQGQPIPLRAAIGCEYPSDASGVDEISWLAIAIEYGPKRERAIVFSYETA